MLKVTFLFSYFCVTKSTKSQPGGLAPSSFRITGGVHELVARSSAWQVRAARGKVVKVGGFAALHGFIYTTRANIAHEEAEQIRARIVCTPTYKCKAGINTYAEHVCWRRRDGASWIEFVCGRDFQNKPYLAMFTPRLLPLWRRVAQFPSQPAV